MLYLHLRRTLIVLQACDVELAYDTEGRIRLPSMIWKLCSVLRFFSVFALENQQVIEINFGKFCLLFESCVKCLETLISGFHRAFLKSITFYWPTNALNCIKLKG